MTALSPKRKKAISKLKRIEDGLAHAQATIPRYIEEAREVRELLEGPKDDTNGKDSPDAPDQ